MRYTVHNKCVSPNDASRATLGLKNCELCIFALRASGVLHQNLNIIFLLEIDSCTLTLSPQIQQ